ncbi:MAG TPA: histidine phosphatase family protein [Bryobacteraceae bacterium]|nr:histidine phosphatase family protein [Bryobacteraceae bacterium]
MQVHLLRHGIAEEGHAGLSDADRALTSEGRKKLRQVLQTAAKAGVQPTLMLSSPYKRAIQSAEIAKRTLGYSGEILQTKVLAPGSNVEQVWEEIRVHRGEMSLLLAGHNPLFEHLAGYLLGHSNLKMEFKKGALLRLDVESFGVEPRGVLRWCLTAKLAESGS